MPAIVAGIKTFEVRKNDRNFKVGDRLLLKPVKDGKPTDGAAWVVEVTYVLPGGRFGVAEDYVIMSIKLVGPWLHS